jgi:UDP-glucose 4-epimerase
VRPFNVYGPGQVGEGAMRIFIERALVGEPLIVHGDGSQIRAWCYIDDMVRSVLIALDHPAAVGESFNVGNARATATMAALANAVVRITGSASPIEYRPRAGADVDLRVPSTEKATELIGFTAEVDLDEGIDRTAAWVKAHGAH